MEPVIQLAAVFAALVFFLPMTLVAWMAWRA